MNPLLRNHSHKKAAKFSHSSVAETNGQPTSEAIGTQKRCVRIRKTVGIASLIGMLLLIKAIAAEGNPSAKPAVAPSPSTGKETHTVRLDGTAGGKRFDGIGAINGGGSTSVLLKDYPEPQRSQILDLVYKPMFGASLSALYVEIPGDANSTQSTMPSHMHTRLDLNYRRGYIWWALREAKKRNPAITLDGTAWSAPGWIDDTISKPQDKRFWSQDAADYYVKWLQGLRSVYGLELDAIGCRNESGVSYDFVKTLRATLNANGFEKVKVHAFDNWPEDKIDFVKDMLTDEKLCDSIDIISAHTFSLRPAKKELIEIAERLNKPIWNTEDHVYSKGFDCAIGIVKVFNTNFVHSGVTKIVNWYDIAGVYPLEPYSEDPSMILARSPWSGNYKVREALWGYAHYGQFTRVGWSYLNGGSGELAGGGSFVTMKSPANDYSIIIETKDAKAPQKIRFELGRGLSAKDLCLWRSNAKEQFIRQADIKPAAGVFELNLEPGSIYSLSTTSGQQKGSFKDIPEPRPFPFPYHETFDEYSDAQAWGYVPHYNVDFAGVFEITERPDKKGKCLRQAVPVVPHSWAKEYYPYYTLLGDDQWGNYEVSADVLLNPGDTAGVMGRVNDIGNGDYAAPKGYFFTLGDDGLCQLVVSRGQKGRKQKLLFDPLDPVEDRMKRENEDGEGGERELASSRLADFKPGQWHNVKLCMEGAKITASVDDKLVLTATDALYSRGMAGLVAGNKAGKEEPSRSMPYYDNLVIKQPGAPVPAPSPLLPGQTPLY